MLHQIDKHIILIFEIKREFQVDDWSPDLVVFLMFIVSFSILSDYFMATSRNDEGIFNGQVSGNLVLLCVMGIGTPSKVSCVTLVV